MEEKLPEKIYVGWEEEGTEEEWLYAHEKMETLATQEERLIGVYELKETRRVRLEVTSKVVSRMVEPSAK